MYIRTAVPADIDEILGIYAYARRFMAEHGNPTQWGSTKPTAAEVEAAIADGTCRVCIDKDRIACVFCYFGHSDPTYAVIDGAWLSDSPYGVVHRIASAPETHGAASFCLGWAFAQKRNLRIDTHADNIPMQSLLSKLGFVKCGIIRLADGSPRLAYQKLG